MNYIETCTKIAVFLWRSSNYRPLTSVLHVRPGWIIYQNIRETCEKKVMKFEREIPIGLDARRKKWRGGGAIKAPPPPMGLGLIHGTVFYYSVCFLYYFIFLVFSYWNLRMVTKCRPPCMYRILEYKDIDRTASKQILLFCFAMTPSC